MTEDSIFTCVTSVSISEVFTSKINLLFDTRSDVELIVKSLNFSLFHRIPLALPRYR